ncbi:MAG: penicillin-binding protein 1C, partial [Bacteroidota bacterium]
EDRRFLRHWGVDWRALLRALRQNMRAGKVVSGGSTISMQVVRMARGNRSRTIWQKLIEISLALRLELTYSKTEILGLWAANAPFGGNVVGLEAASWRYYQKASHLLTWSEAATLAVLPNSPALIHPGRNRSALKHKRDRLLGRLRDEGIIDPTSHELAIVEPLPERPLPLPRLAPRLLDRVAQEQGPGRWRLSIKADLQQQVRALARRHQERLAHNGIHNLAILVLETHSGKVLSYLGNLEHLAAEHSPSVDLVQAPRSPGSLLKPALYALALEEGLILPKELLPDIPSVFGNFRPENFHQAYQGAVSADLALARSLNIPFVHLLQRYGVAPFHQALRDWGMGYLSFPPDHYGLSLILGGAEVSLWEMTAWYAALARTVMDASRWQGQYHRQNWRPPHYLPRSNAAKDSLRLAPLHISSGAAWQTLQALEQLQRPSSEGDWKNFASSQRMAWKTGTSFGFRDAWSVGVDPDYTIGIWVGNADGEGRPGLVGVQAAAPLLFAVRRLLPNNNDWFTEPVGNLNSVRTCKQSGQLANGHCPNPQSTKIPRTATQARNCAFHQLLFLNSERTERIHQGCISPAEQVFPTSWFQLPPLQAHYFQPTHPEYAAPPPWKPSCAPTDVSQQPMQWIYPVRAERITIPKTWDGQRSAVIFALTHQESPIAVHWHLDGEFLATTYDSHTMELQPPSGKHTLLVVDAKGNRLNKAFAIVD